MKYDLVCIPYSLYGWTMFTYWHSIGAPVGEPVYSALSGYIYSFGVLPNQGDYGHSVVVEHQWKNKSIWALWSPKRGIIIITFNRRSGAMGVISLRLVQSQRMGVATSPALSTLLTAPEGHDMPGVVILTARHCSLSIP